MISEYVYIYIYVINYIYIIYAVKYIFILTNLSTYMHCKTFALSNEVNSAPRVNPSRFVSSWDS